MPLQKHNLDTVAAFLRSPAWPDLRQCAEASAKISPPSVMAAPDVAAAIAHQRAGFEACLAAIEDSVRQQPIDPNATSGSPSNGGNGGGGGVGADGVSPIIHRIATDEGVSASEVLASFNKD